MDGFPDGAGDTMAFDTDDDGYAETTVIDSDHDGHADAALVDDVATGDSIAYVDTDLDGDIDTKVIDLGSDGVVDDVQVDDPAGPDDDSDDVDVVAADPFAVEQVEDDGIHGDPMAEIQFHQAQPGP